MVARIRRYGVPIAFVVVAVAMATPHAQPRARQSVQAAQASLAGWQADFDGDGKPDFCQIATRSGFSGLTCRIAGTNQVIQSGNLDLGFPEGRAFVDFDGDKKQDYCRVVGNSYPNSHVTCTLSEGKAFGATLQSPPLDWGYPDTRQWRDANGDGRADFCRVVGSYRDTMACTFSQGRTKPYFGRTATSKR